MFNATEIRARAKCATRLDSYFKRHSFAAIAAGLLADNIPEDDIMRTTRGPNGRTMLHDAFFIDLLQWIGGPTYYKATRLYTTYPTRTTPTP